MIRHWVGIPNEGNDREAWNSWERFGVEKPCGIASFVANIDSKLTLPPLARRVTSSGNPFVTKVSAYGLLAIVVLSCAPQSSDPERIIDIVATEYAFQAPDTVAPGPAVLRLMNNGKVLHEMILMKLRPGVSLADLVAAQQRDESFRPQLDGGNAVLFAGPGTTGDGRLSVDLEQGRDYVVWCNFQDGDTAPKHSALGMFRLIHVAGSADAERSAAPVHRVIVDVGDYVFRVADTLAAGETEFAMTNSGIQRHEVALSRLKAGTTPAIFFAEYQKGNDVDSLYDDDGAILTAYGGGVNEFALRVDLIAGRSYVLLCEFRDTVDAPSHARMGMFKGIEVR